MKLTIKQRAVLIRIAKLLAFNTAILAATKLTLEFGSLSNNSTAAFSFLIIVLLSAFFGDLFVAIITSFSAALCFDYFYLPPFGTFYINAFSDWISLAAFLLASIIISYLTASAEENKVKAIVLNKTLAQIKEFGERLLSIPPDQLTLAGITRDTLNTFSLDYCSIHVYGEGKWQHFTGSASSDIPQEIGNKLKYFEDHATDLLEIADEEAMGVTFAQINKGKSALALLAVKSKMLPAEAVGTIAYMIGVQLSNIMKD
jgi:K+-sensing histidine kinase KdpD